MNKNSSDQNKWKSINHRAQLYIISIIIIRLWSFNWITSHIDVTEIICQKEIQLYCFIIKWVTMNRFSIFGKYLSNELAGYESLIELTFLWSEENSWFSYQRFIKNSFFFLLNVLGKWLILYIYNLFSPRKEMKQGKSNRKISKRIWFGLNIEYWIDNDGEREGKINWNRNSNNKAKSKQTVRFFFQNGCRRTRENKWDRQKLYKETAPSYIASSTSNLSHRIWSRQ